VKHNIKVQTIILMSDETLVIVL